MDGTDEEEDGGVKEVMAKIMAYALAQKGWRGLVL
jgi:hypothetical protein